MLQIHQFLCLSDNYGFLLHDPDSGETVAIDTPDGDRYLEEADAKGWTITQIWNTHWHPDHAGGNETVAKATGAKIVAPAEVAKLSAIDTEIKHGDTVSIGSHEARVIDVSGHTNGHIAYHLPQDDIAFVGDSVFALGCGRMFEGEAGQFWQSLQRIKALPPKRLSIARTNIRQPTLNSRFTPIPTMPHCKTMPPRSPTNASGANRPCRWAWRANWRRTLSYAPTMPTCRLAGAAAAPPRPSRRCARRRTVSSDSASASVTVHQTKKGDPWAALFLKLQSVFASVQIPAIS
jgi:hypothetical protein